MLGPPSEKKETEKVPEEPLTRHNKALSYASMRQVRLNPEGINFRQFMRDSFRTKERFKIISRLLEISTKEEDRLVAVEGLGAFGHKGTPYLTQALQEDPSWRVRQIAAMSLGQTGDLSAKEALLSAEKDPDKRVALAATEALDVLIILAKVSPPDVFDYEYLHNSFKDETDSEAKESTIFDLEKISLYTELQLVAGFV